MILYFNDGNDHRYFVNRTRNSFSFYLFQSHDLLPIMHHPMATCFGGVPSILASAVSHP